MVVVRAREPLAAGVPQTVRDLLFRLLDATTTTPIGAPDDRGRSLLAARLGADYVAEHWAALAAVLGWIPDDAPELQALAVAPSALAGAKARAVGTALRRLAARRPLAVILDDAQLSETSALLQRRIGIIIYDGSTPNGSGNLRGIRVVSPKRRHLWFAFRAICCTMRGPSYFLLSG